MGKIIVSENVTLDGATRDPTGEEGAPRGGWFAEAGPIDREAFGEAALHEARAAEAFLMGRRTYEFLASRWPTRTGALADALNSIPKYVVSTTLERPVWNNTTVIAGEPLTQIATLKEQIDGEIIVPASFELVRTLFERELVDELRVMVYPVILGTGGRLFDQITEKVSLRLLDNRSLGEHLIHAAYEVVRAGVSPTSS